jgi:hypothetical protein
VSEVGLGEQVTCMEVERYEYGVLPEKAEGKGTIKCTYHIGKGWKVVEWINLTRDANAAGCY